jgi:tetratricopeptide (TPR) repeat protein
MSFFSLFSKKAGEIASNEEEGEKYFRQALQCYQYGNQDDAIKFFTKSLEISPNHSAVYVNRAGCYMIQERYLQAYDDYLHAIDMEDRGESIDAESSKPAALLNMKRLQAFITFNQENGEGVKSQLRTDGLDHFTKRWAEVLLDQFLDNNTDMVNQFILEEIKELEGMGGEHQEYALNCGVNHSDFSKVGEQFDTQYAFIMFKSVLCCFSREPHKMFEIRTTILNKLISISNSHKAGSSNQKVDYDGRMRLVEAEVDIMFIVKNKKSMYINNHADQLYTLDKDGDMKLDGRIVNFTFKDSDEVIEIFVAFDDQDSYSMFTMNMGRDERLNYVAQSIFQFMGQNNITNVFSSTARYSSQYHYTFKLYKKNEKHFMVNNSQSQAYLIADNIYKSDNADEIKSEFWEMA